MSVPKQAKRVFQGIIFNIYQWPQKMYDGSVKTFEKAVRQNTVVIVPIVNGKIAVLKQKQPGMDWFYDLPSGRMDKRGESPKQAALRELKEETGLQPRSLKLWKTYNPSGKVVQRVYFFIAEDCKQVAGQSLDPGERIEIFYKRFDDFLKLSDHVRCFFGPLMLDVLLARLHTENYRYLKQSFFGKWKRPPRLPVCGPRMNW